MCTRVCMTGRERYLFEADLECAGKSKRRKESSYAHDAIADNWRNRFRGFFYRAEDASFLIICKIIVIICNDTPVISAADESCRRGGNAVSRFAHLNRSRRFLAVARGG